MVSVYDLKSRFQDLLRPTCRWLHGKNITANQVTISAVILSAICGLIVYLSQYAAILILLVPILLFVRMALNAIDGMIAKEFNQSSKLGIFLNELGDVVSDILMYFPFIYLGIVNPILILLFIVLAVISEFCGVIAVQAGGNRRYDGPMGKSDRAFVFGALCIFIAFGVINYTLFNIFMVLLILLLCLTIKNRVSRAIKQ